MITNLRLARAEQSGPATSKAMAGGLMHCGIAGDLRGGPRAVSYAFGAPVFGVFRMVFFNTSNTEAVS